MTKQRSITPSPATVNREIKFRAYIEAEERFIFCDDSEENYLGTFFTAVRQIEKISGKKMPIDQFTGLRDKNGEEIYEADILKLADPEALPEELELEPQQAIWVGAGYVIKGATGVAVHPRRWHVYEVIGNIYENPDLLN